MDNFLLIPRIFSSVLFDAAFAGVFGVLLARLWLNSSAQCDPVVHALRRGLLLSAMILVLILPVQLWLLTATMIGTSSPPDVTRQLADVLTGTHAGRVLIPDLALSLILFITSIIPPLSRSRVGTYLGLAVVITLAIMRSASGHAASEGDFTLREAAQFLHLASIAVWSGGVMVAGLIVVPRLLHLNKTETIASFGAQLSRTATVAVLIVALTGIYNAWRGLEASLHPLVHTPWGKVLLLKSLLVFTALALGTTNRLLLRQPEPLLPPNAKRFATLMRIEAIVMLAILAVSGWLANSPPAVGS